MIAAASIVYEEDIKAKLSPEQLEEYNKLSEGKRKEKAQAYATEYGDKVTLGVPIALLIVLTALAIYLWTEAKEYEKLANDANRGDDDDNFDKVDDEEE